MSINAITSVSLYEYYYTINKKEKEESPIAKEMREYGLTPTDNEVLNVSMLKKAKEAENTKDAQKNEEVSYYDRPWADLMNQLNIAFNPNPKDDIEDIKDELASLTRGIDDDELNQEIADLEDYVERLYLNFEKNSSTNSIDLSYTLGAQLNNMSMINRANLL